MASVLARQRSRVDRQAAMALRRAPLLWRKAYHTQQAVSPKDNVKEYICNGDAAAIQESCKLKAARTHQDPRCPCMQPHEPGHTYGYQQWLTCTR